MKYFKSIKYCRISKKKDLIKIAKFPAMGLTGTFPKSLKKKIIKTPLEVVFSRSSKLLQLKHNYKSEILYGENYGYRSGLNPVMIKHLKDKASFLKKTIRIKDNFKILDIGANDGTFLNFFSNKNEKYGIDPTINKFKIFHKKETIKISKPFLEGVKKIKSKKFNLITAIAMFYDLEDPVKNLKKIKSLLNKNGIFHMEVAYLPAIIKNFSYDTFCQEHYEYYSLISLNILIGKVGMKIADFGFNSINGGSIWLNITHKENNKNIRKNKLKKQIKLEYKEKIHLPNTYKIYFNKVFNHANSLKKIVTKLKKTNKIIYGYGASTKGNVLLQLSKIDSNYLSKIVDVNPYKLGRFTPLTNIKITNEKELKNKNVNYVLLLIWHLKKHSLENIRKLNNKLKVIIPFPKIKIL